ncbi:thiamine pyrophosphate-dependent enzyme [Nocardioides sp. B-3]|nr:thiamine pyrophosphate-dependent enzyme [Nocardioides sp. B-3]UUZ61582.1 thiamine pyrophosphate-dependent enzyme [Nocardioides sp. B-3]
MRRSARRCGRCCHANRWLLVTSPSPRVNGATDCSSSTPGRPTSSRSVAGSAKDWRWGWARPPRAPTCPRSSWSATAGSQSTLGELASLAGSRAWCVVIVFNDGGYGVLRNMQRANGFDEAGVDLYTPDFALLAASLAMPYHLIRGAGEFDDAFRDALAVRGPVIVEVDVGAIEPTPGAFVPPVHVPTREG